MLSNTTESSGWFTVAVLLARSSISRLLVVSVDIIMEAGTVVFVILFLVVAHKHCKLKIKPEQCVSSYTVRFDFSVRVCSSCPSKKENPVWVRLYICGRERLSRTTVITIEVGCSQSDCISEVICPAVNRETQVNV